DTIKKTVDIYLSKLSEFVKNDNKAAVKQKRNVKQRQTNKEIMQEALIKQGIVNPEGSTKKKSKRKTSTDNSNHPTLVERIPEELRLIKRFINLDGKTKTKDDILRFVNSLQKAIL